MHSITITAVALSNHDYPSLEAKLREAASWVRLAARQGAQLVILPEMLSKFRGDGAGREADLPLAACALDDWRTACATLLDAAQSSGVALVLPLLVRDGGEIVNLFYFIAEDGSLRGSYEKLVPTPSECRAGVRPGDAQPLIQWRGLNVGGAICFDCYHQQVFAQQAAAGANLVVVPSLTPAGLCLDYYALRYSLPVALAYPAWSRILDADAHELAAGGYRHETLRFGFGSPLVTAEINFDSIVLFADLNQQKILDVERKYGRDVRIRFDQHNATFLLESRSDKYSARDLADEFGLVSRRDYFDNAAPQTTAAR